MHDNKLTITLHIVPIKNNQSIMYIWICSGCAYIYIYSIGCSWCDCVRQLKNGRVHSWCLRAACVIKARQEEHNLRVREWNREWRVRQCGSLCSIVEWSGGRGCWGESATINGDIGEDIDVAADCITDCNVFAVEIPKPRCRSDQSRERCGSGCTRTEDVKLLIG